MSCNDTLDSNRKREELEMPETGCVTCIALWERNWREDDSPNRSVPIQVHGRVELRGTLKCIQHGHEWPIVILNNIILDTAPFLHGGASDDLKQNVPPELKDDILEAERCHNSACDKAAVTMCRRALQLGLSQKGITDKPLSAMLTDAASPGSQPLLTPDTLNLATSIKAFGDIGAHRAVVLNSKEVALVIYAAVRMLNELFP